MLEANLESPRGIAVHPGIGRMFWTDWDRYGPKIEVANMDGTDRFAAEAIYNTRYLYEILLLRPWSIPTLENQIH